MRCIVVVTIFRLGLIYSIIFFFVFQALVGDVNAINKGKKVEMFDGNSIYALWSEERIKLQEFHEAKDGSYSAAIFLYCMLNE